MRYASIFVLFAICVCCFLMFHDSGNSKTCTNGTRWESIKDKMPREGKYVWIYVPSCDPEDRVILAKYHDEFEEGAAFYDIDHPQDAWPETVISHWALVDMPKEPC